MDRSGLFELLDTIPNEISIFLMGKHGVGKSEIIKQYAESRKKKFVCLILTQRTDGDFVGIPTKIEINGKIYSSFAPPEIFSMISEGEGILCLDELPDAAPDIRNAAQELIQARQLNEVKAGMGWRLMACGNPSGTTAYCTGDLRPQLISRFLMLNFKPSVEEILQYGRLKNWHSSVVSFLEKNDMCMFPPDELEMNVQYPCPRQWERLSSIFVRNEKLLHSKYRFELATGCIGYNTAGMFDKFVKEEYHILRGEDILNGTVRSKVDWEDIPQLAGAISEVAVYCIKNLESKQIKNIKKFIEKCPREVQITYFRKYVKNRRVEGVEQGKSIPDLITKNNAFGEAIFDGENVLHVMEGHKELEGEEEKEKNKKDKEKED